MPLPKITKDTVSNPKSKETLNNAKLNMMHDFCSDDMKNAMEMLAKNNPNNQKIQDMYSTYHMLQQNVSVLVHEPPKEPGKFAERWNKAMDDLNTLSGYDDKGKYAEENTLFSVVNNALDKKTIDTKTYTTLMTLDNNMGSTVSSLSSHGKQFGINDVSANYQKEQGVTRNFPHESLAEYFEAIPDSRTMELLSKKGAAEAEVKDLDHGISVNKAKYDAVMKSASPNKEENAESYIHHINGGVKERNHLQKLIDSRNKAVPFMDKIYTGRKNVDNSYKELESTMKSNDYPDQVMQFLDKNIKQMDKGKRLFHRDSKEFKAMKSGMQDLKKYLEENKGKVDLETLKDKLDKLGNTASEYTQAKSKGLHTGSKMRDMRLNLADTLFKFTKTTMQSIAATNDVNAQFREVTQLRKDVHASRDKIPNFNMNSLGDFMASGKEIAKAYRQTHPQQPQQQPQPQNKKNLEQTKQKSGPAVPQ